MTGPFTPRHNPKSGTPKLRPGQLRAQILAILHSAPDKQWRPKEVCDALPGRSSGAIGQALDKLVALGQATATGTPRRYTATTSTSTAAPPPPPTPTTPPAPARRVGPVTRPNGAPYHPRSLGGRADVDVLRELRAADIPVLLYGPPGTGKTSLIEAAYGAELYTLAGDGDTTVGDLLGDYVPDAGGGYRFVDGPLVTAMETGGVFFLDDATLISPKVLAVVYPAMDGRREVVVKAHGGKVVRAKPGFFVVAGHNPGVHGAILTEALASRFTTHIRVSTDYDLATALGVDGRIVRAARTLAGKVDAAEIGWAPYADLRVMPKESRSQVANLVCGPTSSAYRRGELDPLAASIPPIDFDGVLGHGGPHDVSRALVKPLRRRDFFWRRR